MNKLCAPPLRSQIPLQAAAPASHGRATAGQLARGTKERLSYFKNPSRAWKVGSLESHTRKNEAKQEPVEARHRRGDQVALRSSFAVTQSGESSEK